jgi:hypothetical protein
MSGAQTFNIEVREDTQFTLMARFCAISGSGAVSPVAKEGNLITQANVSSTSIKIYDASGTIIGTEITPSAASTVFDTLQSSATWLNIEDGLGGNWRYTVAGTYAPTGDAMQRAEVLITLTDGTVLPGVWSILVQPLTRS